MPSESSPVESPRQHLSASRYIEGIKAGDRSMLAKAITLTESSNPADCDLSAEVLEACLGQDSDQVVVGVSGVPGAGKSSLIEAIGKHIITHDKKKIAVLAIDPSSRLRGGSILGDKTRMPFLATSDMAFVRPSPSRGTHGGVGDHTRDAIVLCARAGYRIVFVETVGVGQSETAVREMVDFLLLVVLSGAGDDLQGIKRGVMEMADAIAVNKADGENAKQAEKARSDAACALQFFRSPASGWNPPAIACSAHTGLGVKEIWAHILEHHKIVGENGHLDRLRRKQKLGWLHENLERSLMQMFFSNSKVRARLAELETDIADGKTTPLVAVRQLMSLYDSERKPKYSES
ncbi:MAG: methylmalonyl Co-A mutase-associated GTPase MeaB [Acidobacteria bacterium]|nr:methylmalonyl Co-A mutase-associated GTPase MeaB [Acidobacteriota bacterium]